MKKIIEMVGIGIIIFCFDLNLLSIEERYLITADNTAQDKWFGSVYERSGNNNEFLKVGGWGDVYYTLIKMPLHFYVPGTDQIIINKAVMNLQSTGSDNPTTMRKYFIRNPWSETSPEDHWSLRLNPRESIPAPLKNKTYSFDITAEFYAWITGAEPNYGIALVPEKINNNFNYFRSSENNVELRPNIEVFYERIPKFKMPLPGERAWKLTTEAGGKTYINTIDSAHTEITYYSLDFSSKWKSLTGGEEQPANNVPILAAAGGIVYEVPSSPHPKNGWYVRIDHDYDGKDYTGFQTVYLHMKYQPMVRRGQIVRSGDQIGIMGNTGESTGDHIHITFYFKGKAGTGPNGFDSSVQLNNIKMENRFIKDFNLNTSWNSSLGQFQPIYYQSTQSLVGWE